MPDRILKPDSGNDLVLQNDDASAKIEINEAGTIVHTGTSSIDVSGGTFTTSTAQKQAIVQAGPGSGTLDVSSGTFTTSSAQKQAIVDGATIEAQDLASGSGTTLPNNVQDAITRLGAVTSGTFNGTIGSSVTFPTGIIETQNIIKYALGSNNSNINEGTTEKIATRKNGNDATVESVSVIGGHTYIYTYQFWLEAWRNSGSNTASRSAKVRLYDDENNHSQGDSSSFGTLIAYGIVGREMASSAGAANTSYAFVTISGASYYSSNDTRYIYITTQPPASSHRNAVYMTSTFPMYLKIEKIKGNLLTTRSS